MDDKEFRRLRRRDFLELLLAQGQEMADLEERHEKITKELEITKESNERIKLRLNEKDALIERLKERLDAKDATIRELQARLEDRRIELREAGSIAMAALKLNGVFEAAQRAADHYLESLKQQFGGQEAQAPETEAELELDAAETEASEKEASEKEEETPDPDMDLAEKLKLNSEHDLEAKAWEEQEKARLEALTAKDEPAGNAGEEDNGGEGKRRRSHK